MRLHLIVACVMQPMTHFDLHFHYHLHEVGDNKGIIKGRNNQPAHWRHNIVN